jgi:general secretion pathway protein D
MSSRLLAVLLSSAVCSFPLFAEDAKAKAPKKELTREELAKLGGFEPAPDAEENVPGEVFIDMLVVSIPDTTAVPLIEAFKDSTKTESTYRKVLELLQNKKARLIGWPNIRTRTGNRAVAENITEVRYAIEFDQNQRPAEPAAAGAEAKKADEAAAAAAPPGPQAVPAIGVVPTTFETRNAGVTLEIEPVIMDGGKMVSMQYAAQHVQLLGWDPVTVHEKEQVTVRIPQPRFHTNKVSSNSTLNSGERALIGVFRSGDAKDETELFILGTGKKAGKKK